MNTDFQPPSVNTNPAVPQPILLTGANGFIGRHVARKLASLRNVRLVCILRDATQDRHAESLSKQGVVIVRGNFYDETAIKNVFEQYQFQQILHLAAIRGGGNASPAEFREV